MDTIVRCEACGWIAARRITDDGEAQPVGPNVCRLCESAEFISLTGDPDR